MPAPGWPGKPPLAPNHVWPAKSGLSTGVVRSFCQIEGMSKRTRMILTGLLPIFGVSAVLLGVGLGGKLPGFPGEVFRMISGIMFTPVFLELTFAFLGLLAIFSINNLRLQKEGDEYVSLEIEDDSEDDPKP